MNDRRSHAHAMALAVLLGASGLGCGPRSGEGSVTPGMSSGAPEGPADTTGPHEGDNFGDLQLRMQRLKAEQRKLVEPAGTDAGVCEDLCGLATSICQVQQKLCEIADEHPDDAAYQRLCREARLECNTAQQSCIDCVQTHSQPNQSEPSTSESSTPTPSTPKPSTPKQGSSAATEPPKP